MTSMMDLFYAQAASGNPYSQSFNVFKGTVSIGFGHGSASTPTMTMGGPNWDQTKWQLQSAQLIVNVTQQVNDGANVHTIWNDVDVGTINYNAWQTGAMQATYDVTSNLLDGANTFSFVYNEFAFNLSFTPDVAYISATLNLVFAWIGSGTPNGNPSSVNPTFQLPVIPWYVTVGLIGAAGLVTFGVVNKLTNGGASKTVIELGQAVKSGAKSAASLL